MDFHEIWYLPIFLGFVEKIQVSLKSEKNNSTLHDDQHTFFITSRSILLRIKNVSDISCRENQNAYFMWNYIFFQISCPLWDNVCKYSWVWKAIYDNTTQRHCMLNTWNYKYTLRICNTYWFSTVTMVTRTRFNITFNLHYLSCFHFKTLSHQEAFTVTCLKSRFIHEI